MNIATLPNRPTSVIAGSNVSTHSAFAPKQAPKPIPLPKVCFSICLDRNVGIECTHLQYWCVALRTCLDVCRAEATAIARL